MLRTIADGDQQTLFCRPSGQEGLKNNAVVCK